jgi:hypothetical protein
METDLLNYHTTRYLVQNCMHKEIKTKLNSSNVLFSPLLSAIEQQKDKITRNCNSGCSLTGVKLLSFTG